MNPSVPVATHPDVEHRRRSGALLVASLLAVTLTAASGAALTNQGLGAWYDALVKPSWNPPASVFGPVWTSLYALLAVAAWLVVRESWTREVRHALALYGAMLLLQVGWSGIFFALRAPLAATAEIVLLLGVSFATFAAFWRVRRAAGLLLAPYLAWSTFAAVLCGTIASLNR